MEGNMQEMRGGWGGGLRGGSGRERGRWWGGGVLNDKRGVDLPIGVFKRTWLSSVEVCLLAVDGQCFISAVFPLLAGHRVSVCFCADGSCGHPLAEVGSDGWAGGMTEEVQEKAGDEEWRTRQWSLLPSAAPELEMHLRVCQGIHSQLRRASGCPQSTRLMMR